MANSAVGFLQEDNGNSSSMRLMCLVSLIASIVFGLMTVAAVGGAANQSTGVYVTVLFLLGAFAPKAVQKIIETKIGVNSNA